mgnify:CR=1 FL=1
MANGQGQETDQQRFARVLKNAREAEDLMKSDVAYAINSRSAPLSILSTAGLSFIRQLPARVDDRVPYFLQKGDEPW